MAATGTPLELVSREHGHQTEWIVGRSGLFISHHDDGDELWLSLRPFFTNERLHKFPKGYTPTLEDIDEVTQ